MGLDMGVVVFCLASALGQSLCSIIPGLNESF